MFKLFLTDVQAHSHKIGSLLAMRHIC